MILRDNIVVHDDFLNAPEFERLKLLKGSFYDVEGPDGEIYRRVQVLKRDDLNVRLSAAVGRPVNQQYSIARLNYVGENPNNAIHADSAYSDFAAVLYLNTPEQCRGGTAFWRHKKTGWEWMPTEKEVRAKGKSPTRVLAQITEDWNNESAWEQVALAEMKFNRVAIYPTKRFHSRYPFEAFGSTPEDGRLIWASFFSV